MSQQRFSQSPDPAKRGEDVTICYDITGADLDPPVEPHGVFHSNGGSEFDWVVQDENTRCTTVKVPSDATGATVSDPSGQSDDFALIVDA